jgi:hypothetical protein
MAAYVLFPFWLLFEHTNHLLSFKLTYISLTAKLFPDFGCLDALKGLAEISISEWQPKTIQLDTSPS